MKEERRSLTVRAEEAGLRLDVFVAQRGLSLTRSQTEKLANSGRVKLGGRPARAGRRVAPGERVDVWLPAKTDDESPVPEPIPLDIFFEDDHVLVLNKPQGLIVHPTAGRTGGTLVNALLAHTRSLAAGSGPHRPGIVHRLDRDTSGLMVVAKSEVAYGELSRQVRRRELERRYLAVVWGNVGPDRLLIQVPLGRHLRDGTRMAAVPRPEGGRRVRSAITDVRVAERLGVATLVEARLETGRTHQIRVHLAHQGHPVVGDRVYGLRRARREKAALDEPTLAYVRALSGHALHAQSLRFRHPVSSQTLQFSAPPPAPMSALLAHLRQKIREMGEENRTRGREEGGDESTP